MNFNIAWLNTFKEQSPWYTMGTTIISTLVFVPLLILKSESIPKGLVAMSALFGAGQKHICYIALFWLFSLSYTLGYFMHSKAKNYQKKKAERLQKEKREKRLHNLAPEEKILLNQYFQSSVKHRTFSSVTRSIIPQRKDLLEGVIIELIKENILYRAGNFFINIHDWAFKYLQKYPELLN